MLLQDAANGERVQYAGDDSSTSLSAKNQFIQMLFLRKMRQGLSDGGNYGGYQK